MNTSTYPSDVMDEEWAFVAPYLTVLPDAKRGFVLLPRRWVVECSLAWMARIRRLARDYERLPKTVAGLTFLAFACLVLPHVIHSP
jgi:transposase